MLIIKVGFLPTIIDHTLIGLNFIFLFSCFLYNIEYLIREILGF